MSARNAALPIPLVCLTVCLVSFCSFTHIVGAKERPLSERSAGEKIAAESREEESVLGLPAMLGVISMPVRGGAVHVLGSMQSQNGQTSRVGQSSLAEQGARAAARLPAGLSGAPIDTFWYGGTVVVGGVPVAGEPSLPGWVNRKAWTWSSGGFNGTAHSGFNMDGWVGVDNTNPAPEYEFRRMTRDSVGDCALNGNWEMFCGLTPSEAWPLCFIDTAGTGYGNGWYKHVVSPTFAYSGSGSVMLTFVYRNDTEPDYDRTYVWVDVYDQIDERVPPDSAWVKVHYLFTDELYYTGSTGFARDTVDISSKLASYGAIKYRIRFSFVSDGANWEYGGGYSDQDGLYPTTCGAFGFDDVTVAGGGVSYVNDFEAGTDWEPVVPPDPTGQIGDFAHTEWIGGLSPAVSDDPCVAVPGKCDLADSVVVLFDPTPVGLPHPYCQDSYFQSPPIPVASHPGYRGFALHYEYFAKIGSCFWGEGDGFHPYWGVRYWPRSDGRCWSDWTQDVYWTQTRGVFTDGLPSCGRTDIDVSTLVPAGAESVQVRLGGFNEDCGCWDCCYQNNNTPYFDNVCFGIYGNDTAPVVTMDETWRWQDQFPKDGTLSPASTVDTRTGLRLNTSTTSIFGDTLLCYSGSADTEVSVVFRLPKVGPGIQMNHVFFATWFPGLLDGEGHPTGAWQVARMDTAESGTSSLQPVLGYWAAAFHEDDLTRAANGLSEGTEILPNGLFTPGTRVEYFLKAKFLGEESEFLLPDTTGENYLEFEVLPMMESAGGELRWPCLLLASHSLEATDDGRYQTELVKDALRANGFAFDEYNRLASAATSSTCPTGFGRAPSTDAFQGPGATAKQLSGYVAVLVSGGSGRYTLSKYDADVLDGWLSLTTSLRPRFLWISGDEALKSLNSGTQLTFLKNRLCASYVSLNYWASSGDVTYCLPVDGWSGGRIQCAPLGGPENEQFFVVANRCPRQFDVAGVSGVSGCSGLKEVAYNEARNGELYAASVSGVVATPGGPTYKTLIEGYDLTAIRSDASLGPLDCAIDTASARARSSWVQCVLGDFGGLEPDSYCDLATIGVEMPSGGTPSVAGITQLGQSYPNPTNPTATIRFSVGKAGKVTLRIYDIAGRVVRTLFDENVQAPGQFNVTWDGRDDRGAAVASGIFFYRLEVSGFRDAKKIVIVQ